MLVDSPALADYAEAAVARGRAGQGRRQLVHRRGARVPERDRALARGAAAPARRRWPSSIGLVGDGTLSRSLAKDVLDECLRERQAAASRSSTERGLAQVSDEGELGARRRRRCSAANADAVAEYRGGDDKVRKKKRGFLFGEVMKATEGQGEPAGAEPTARREAQLMDDPRLRDRTRASSGSWWSCAHPDDVDFGIAGSVATWTDAGIEVTYCMVTERRGRRRRPRAARARRWPRSARRSRPRRRSRSGVTDLHFLALSRRARRRHDRAAPRHLAA